MIEIPDKLYYKIGEVAALLELKTHVLRYWETEFPELRPVKSRSKQRLYRRKDVETALLIKDLLYQQGFTIAGAKKQLQSELQAHLPFDAPAQTAEHLLKDIKTDLLRIRKQLENAASREE